MATAANPYETIVGEYRVIEDKVHSLGAGSVGSVYRAEHVTIEDKFTAAKKTTIPKELFKAGEFEKEADLLMNKIPLHENIIKVYDIIKKEYEEAGVEMIDIWLIMEYAPLGNLKEFAQKNNLTIEQKVELMFQSALGIKHLHDCKPESVTHRDIKPQNIVITGSVDNPIARISDFGAGKAVLQRSITEMSQSGTPTYSTLEQTRLQDEKPKDIFDLGITFQSLLESSKDKVTIPKTEKEKGIEQAMCQSSAEHGVPDFSLQTDHPSDGPVENALRDIIKQMIELKPSDRMSISDVVERLTVLRTSTSTVEKLSVLKVSTQKLIAIKGRSVWVREGLAWEKLPDMPQEQPDRGVCYCSASDGIVAVGGKECHRFSLLTKCWSRLKRMAKYRWYASAVVLLDTMMVLGGEDIPLNTVALCQMLHFSKARWSPAASMRKPLWRPLVAAAAGKVFVVPRSLTISPDTCIQEYDPDTDEFREAAPLPQQVQNTWEACLVGARDKVYLLGGVQGLALQFSPHTGQWVELSPPSAGYDTSGCCGVVQGDKLLLCGGSSESNDGNMVEEYDQHTQQWETADFTLPFRFNSENSFVGIAHV